MKSHVILKVFVVPGSTIDELISMKRREKSSSDKRLSYGEKTVGVKLKATKNFGK